MARKATGQVIEVPGKNGSSWALRFSAYNERRYVTLGSEGWNRDRAEEELANVLADVRRGLWRPPRKHPEPVEGRPVPTFHEFATDWLDLRKPDLRPKTIESYEWQLCKHLLPHLAELPLDVIGPQEVDRYKAAKLREGAIGPNQINKTLGTLARILDDAADYGHLDVNRRNPARGPRRRAKRTKPNRPTFDVEQLPTLLECAGRQRPILATLAGAGLRDGEACDLDWGDVNLASGTVSIRESKTDAGVRQVDLPLAVAEELREHKARSSRTAPGDPVFVTGKGERENVSNLGRRLKTVLRRADEELERIGLHPIGHSVTPYSFRRLYASLRAALGDDVVYIAEQMGHADGGGLLMRVYATAVRRRARLAGVTLAEFDRACAWAGSSAAPAEPKRQELAETSSGSSDEPAELERERPRDRLIEP